MKKNFSFAITKTYGNVSARLTPLIAGLCESCTADIFIIKQPSTQMKRGVK